MLIVNIIFKQSELMINKVPISLRNKRCEGFDVFGMKASLTVMWCYLIIFSLHLRCSCKEAC